MKPVCEGQAYRIFLNLPGPTDWPLEGNRAIYQKMHILYKDLDLKGGGTGAGEGGLPLYPPL